MLRLLFLLIFTLFLQSIFAQSGCDSCWIKTELYFGMSIPTGGKVNQIKWNRFSKQHISPNFPEGSTVVKAKGQWFDKTKNSTISENSRVLIVVYLQRDEQAKNEKLKEISSAYIKQFNQQGVMRIDEVVSVKFYSE